MMVGPKRNRLIEFIALGLGFLLAVALLVLRTAGDGVLEKGDGVYHYLIARYSWRHPELFLDLWGKPLFTLLASPFAQVGHFGVAVFNIVVAMTTACAGVLALRKAGGVAQMVFPFLVLLAPQYVMMTLAGMTEPLFGLLSVLSILFLVYDRPVLAAIVASLTPFARPEYVAFLPAVCAWLVLRKEWRALPWCLFGFVFYALLTTVVWGEPLWFWTSDPYQKAGGFYGSGPLDFFVHRAEQVFGRPLLTLGLVALVLWPVIWWHDQAERRTHLMMLITAAAPALGIVLIHSLLWFVGTRGSAGLLRVLVTSIPMAALFAGMTLGRGGLLLWYNVPRAPLVGGLVALGIGVWSYAELVKQEEFPIRADHSQRLMDRVAKDLAAHRTPGVKVFSTHPYMAFGAGLDPYDPATYIVIYGFDQALNEGRFRTGDLLVWDSQLGSNEAGIKLEQILNDNSFSVLEIYEPREGYRVLGGYPYELFLFERRNAVRTFTTDTLIWNGTVLGHIEYRADRLQCPEDEPRYWCLKGGEFPLEFTNLPVPATGDLYDEWIISAKVTCNQGSPLSFVLKQAQEGQDIRYDQQEVRNGDLLFSRRVPALKSTTVQTIYFWNMSREPFSLEGLTVLRKRWTQRPA